MFRKKLLFALLFVVVASCSDSAEFSTENNPDEMHERIVPIAIDFAQHFRIKTTKNSYTLELLDPNSGAVEETFLLTYDQKAAGKNTIHLPCKQIANLSQTTVGMMTLLDKLESICAVSSRDYVYNSKLIERIDGGKVQAFGDESTVSVEAVIGSNASLVLYSGFGDEFPNAKKLEKLGIGLLPIYDWRETHPLGKAEWIKLIGILTGRTQEAIDFFENVQQEYTELAQRTATVEHRPSVMSGSMMGGTWYAPAGESYMSMLFADAGADYVYRMTKGTGSIERTIEQLLSENAQTNFWLNPGIPSARKLREAIPQVKAISAFPDHTFCYTSNSNKFWELSAAQPHLVLSDFIHLFHPELMENGSLHFYSRLAP